jgi:hypothetical protein
MPAYRENCLSWQLFFGSYRTSILANPRPYYQTAAFARNPLKRRIVSSLRCCVVTKRT